MADSEAESPNLGINESDKFDEYEVLSGYKALENAEGPDSYDDPHKEIKQELNRRLQEIKHHLKERRQKYKQELKERILTIEKDEKVLKNISKNFRERWKKIQNKTLFLSVMRQMLRNARNFGIDTKKIPEIVDQEESKKTKWSVIYPDGIFLKIHVMIMFIILVYLIIFFPLDIAFNLEEKNHFWVYLDASITIYFTFDIFVSLLTAFERRGQLIDENWPIAKNYLTKWFIIDLLTVVPFDYIFPQTNFRYKRLLKVPRMLRLINSMFQNTESKKKTRNMVVEKLKLIFGGTARFQIIYNLITTCIFIHITACLYLFVGNAYSEDRDNWIKKSRMNEFPHGNPDIRSYLMATYWVVATIATVGYGDISPSSKIEILFTLIFLIFGVFIYTSTISLSSALLQNQ